MTLRYHSTSRVNTAIIPYMELVFIYGLHCLGIAVESLRYIAESGDAGAAEFYLERGDLRVTILCVT